MILEEENCSPPTETMRGARRRGPSGRGVGGERRPRCKLSSDLFVSRRPCTWFQASEFFGDPSSQLGGRPAPTSSQNRRPAPTRSRAAPSWCLSYSLALLLLIANSADFLPGEYEAKQSEACANCRKQAPQRTRVNTSNQSNPPKPSLAPEAAESVDCFKCSSRNGSNPLCEDPFHNTNTTRVTSPILPEPHPHVIYHTPCYAGKKGRDGLFPASACIKLTGIFDKTGETLVVRHCALDSGSLTQDTELARMSHCGKFQFEGDLLRGCVLACPEDACNSAPPHKRLLQSRSGGGLLALIMWLFSMFMSLCLIHWL